MITGVRLWTDISTLKLRGDGDVERRGRGRSPTAPNVLGPAGVHSVCRAGRQAGRQARCTEGGEELKGSALAGLTAALQGPPSLSRPRPGLKSLEAGAWHGVNGRRSERGPAASFTLVSKHSSDTRALSYREETGRRSTWKSTYRE